MARKSKKKGGGKTELDWSEAEKGGGGGFRIPEGDYKMQFSEVSREESKEGNDMLVWDFTGLEGKAKKKSFRIWTSLLPEALWKLGNLLDAMGIERPESVEDIIEAVESEDPAPIITGTVADDEYEGKTRSKVMDFSSADGSDAEDEDEGKGKKKKGKKGKKDKDEDEKVSKDTVNEADEDELEELVKEHELEVDLDDHRTLKKKRAAVIEALEEADKLEGDDEDAGDEDEGSKRRGKKGKKDKDEGGDKLAKSEVSEMDEEELADVNKKNKLKVDLDEFRTIKKKRGAIIEALEEKDLLEDDE